MTPLRFALVFALWAQPGFAEPLDITFHNAATVEGPAVELQLLLHGMEPFTVATDCAPQSECTVLFDVPSGCWVASLRARGADGSGFDVWSEPNEVRAICTEIGRYDATGDGLVTTLDFTAFRDAFIRSSAQ